MRYLILLFAVSIFSCSQENKVYEKVESGETNFKLGIREFEIYIIDSCEYIGSEMYGNGALLTHKGNCKFCIQRNK